MEHKSFIHSTEEWASILWMRTIKSTAKRNYSLLKNINTKIEASPTNKNNNKSVPSDEQRDDDRKTGKTYVWCRWNRPRPSPYVVICAHPHNFRHVYRILVWCLVCMFEQPRIAVKTVSHKIAINWIHIKAAVQCSGEGVKVQRAALYVIKTSESNFGGWVKRLKIFRHLNFPSRLFRRHIFSYLPDDSLPSPFHSLLCSIKPQ